jgi:putative oxidoreductase
LAANLPPLAGVQLLAAAAAALLVVGVWTPVAGVLLAVAEICLAFSHSNHSNDPWIHILLGVLGASLAMLGPGAWSVDARLFGRKRIQIPQR